MQSEVMLRFRHDWGSARHGAWCAAGSSGAACMVTVPVCGGLAAQFLRQFHLIAGLA